MQDTAILSQDISVADLHARRHKNGRIKIGVQSKSGIALKILAAVLIGLTVYAFLSFDYKEIDFFDAAADTLHNIKTVFLEPRLSRDTIFNVLYQLLVTFCLGILSTIFGAVLAFFCSLLCAKNIAASWLANIIKSLVALVRAVPTVLWVLIFAVSAGLGSVAAVIGLTFHSFAYLTKVYAESIEEIDSGTIEALRASGAGFWQIVFQAILPASISRMVAWTFMRFEINFTNAVAMGAAAGAGGIGFQLYMAGSFYFDLHEMGFLTYVVVIAVILLEMVSTKIKAKVK
ncbi:MAG: PhnE/PtxC family ABC transporter permease [Ruminococcus sp.]